MQVQNPFLGNWIVIESNIIEVKEKSGLRVFVSSKNTIQGNLSERRGKEYAFLRNNQLDHHNYFEIEGDFSSFSGLKLDHKALVSDNLNQLTLWCYTKDGADFGEVKFERR